jgi:putative sigma-54 modulation protein
MRLELTGRHVDITPALRRLVDTKLAKLERVLNDSAVSAQAVLTREKNGLRADITLHARGEKFLHGVAKTGTWETSLGEAVSKISQQAHKVKGKWHDRNRRALKAGEVAAAENVGGERLVKTVAKIARAPRPVRARLRMPRIVRTARQPIVPMSLAQAAREVDANGEGVVVFRDPETRSVSVLYRRPNGELTLLETEV